MDMSLFVAGAIGTLAPEAVRLYRLATEGKTFAWSPGFYISMSLVMAGLGGLIAAKLPTGNWQSAFYAGMGTPALIAAGARQVRGDKPASPPDANKTFSGPSARSVPPARPRVSRVDAYFRAL
jgi:hypothetical protein